MPDELIDSRAKKEAARHERSLSDGAGRQAKEYPVREYIGSMAQELAQMARFDGDECLAVLLDAVAFRASEPAPTPASRHAAQAQRPSA